MPSTASLAERLSLDAVLPLLAAALAIRAILPPHRASTTAQARCSQDAFARLGLIHVPPIVISSLYTLALLWYLHLAWDPELGQLVRSLAAARSAAAHLESSIWAAGPLSPGQTRWTRLAWLVGGLGGALRCWCYKELQHFFTFNLAVLDDHRIISSGPYAYVRHPSYTGLFLLTAGLNMLMQALPIPLIGSCPSLRAASILLFCAYVIWTRIADEEAMLLRAFDGTRRRRSADSAVSVPEQQDGKSNTSNLLRAPCEQQAAALQAVDDEQQVEATTLSASQVDAAPRTDSPHPAQPDSVDRTEEEYDYEAYRRKVPYKLVPYLI